MTTIPHPLGWFHRPRRHALLRDGTRVYLRPLIPADLSHAGEYFSQLSDASRYRRFHTPTPVLGRDTVRVLARQSRDRRCAVIVALACHNGGAEIVGGGRLVHTGLRSTCEFALTVVDLWQGRGVGSALLRELVGRARALGYHRIEGLVLASNTPMISVARRTRMGVRMQFDDPGVVTVSRALFPLPFESPQSAAKPGRESWIGGTRRSRAQERTEGVGGAERRFTSNVVRAWPRA
jgi:RimJ/RimL family protein N-acetyltransferase